MHTGPEETAEVCQIHHPQLGPVCTGVHPSGRDGDRVRGTGGAAVRGGRQGAAVRSGRHWEQLPVPCGSRLHHRRNKERWTCSVH